MYVDHLDKSTGTFTLTVDPQLETLYAGTEKDPKTGKDYPVKWLPCTECLRLEKVHMNVVSFFCCDDCANLYEEKNFNGQPEIPGTSHACGYHD